MHVKPSPRPPRRSGALTGRVRVPGDKSISHRSLILGALAVGETRITGLLEAEDVLNTGHAMRAFGAVVTRDGPGEWRVWGRGVGGWREPDNVLDFGNSGTGSRLGMGALGSPGSPAGSTGRRAVRRGHGTGPPRPRARAGLDPAHAARRGAAGRHRPSRRRRVGAGEVRAAAR